MVLIVRDRDRTQIPGERPGGIERRRRRPRRPSGASTRSRRRRGPPAGRCAITTDTGKQQFRQELDDLVAAFADASAREADPAGEEGLAVGRRQDDWIRTAWGREPTAEGFTGLGQMYVDDPRFGTTYSVEGRSFAPFVRDVMAACATTAL